MPIWQPCPLTVKTFGEENNLTRAYESFKNVLANLAVVFQNLQAQQKLSLALACWLWSFISPGWRTKGLIP